MKYYDVFVYGTLRQGGTNHYYLEEAMCIKNNIWLPGFRLYDFDQQYPFMVYANPDEKVRGELYCINQEQLQLLNVLEDVQNKLYKLVYAEESRCFTYIKYDDEVGSLIHVDSGDWIQYINNLIRWVAAYYNLTGWD